MKFFKKIVSLLLVTTIVVTTCVGFSSCSRTEEAVGKMTVSEYLVTLVDEFGMYIGNEELTYDEALKVAKQWGVIDTDIAADKTVINGFVLVTLVKTVGFYDVSSLTDEEIADYAKDNGYNSFSYKGKKDFNKCPNKNEVIESIENAKEIWANPNFEKASNIEFNDDVVDLTNASVVSDKTTELKRVDNGRIDGSSSESSNEDSSIENASFKRNKVVLDGNIDIKEGQTYVSPTMGESGTYEMYVAEKVEHKDGYTYITNSDEKVDIEETLKEASGSDSGTVTDLTSMPITDGDGNIHYPTTATNTSVYEDAVVIPMSYNSDSSIQIEPMKANASTEFTVKFGDELSATVTVKESSFKCKISGEIAKKESSSKNSKASLKVDKSFEVKDISYNYDYNIFKKNAYLSVSATQVETTGISVKAETGKPIKVGEKDIKDLPEAANVVISKTLAKVPIVSNGVVSVCLLVKAKVSLSGSVELVVTTQSTYGAELKNGNLRLIKNVKRDKDVTINAKVEVTAYVGPALYVGTKNVFSFGFEGGIGASYKLTLHVVDAEKQLELFYQDCDLNVSGNLDLQAGLKCDICQDINVYWILKFSVDDECLLISLLNKIGVSKISTSVEIFGKDNSSFIKKHIEDGKDVGKCTRKYIGKEGTTEAEVENYADSIELENFSLTTYEGKSVTVGVTAVPNGYKSSELIYESSDNSIATVSSKGVVKGIKSGTVIITVYTKDKKYSSSIAVTVMTKLALNNSDKIEVKSI